jgi:hypothetical protein
VTDRTAAALASALPIIQYGHWTPQTLATFQAEHYAEALALIHDHVEASDE